MRELTISKNEAGQRFDKYLLKYLNKAPSSFIYKMLRKKNIVLNDKKANGNEKLAIGDSVKLYLAEDTINLFMDIKSAQIKEKSNKISHSSVLYLKKTDIIYEDNNVLLINKPLGLLSQNAGGNDISVNDLAISYLLESGSLKESELQTFKPSICNRLDRNTTGIIAVGKSLPGIQELSLMFKERTIEKYYLTLVKGKITKADTISGYLVKNPETNKVSIRNISIEGSDDTCNFAFNPEEYIKTSFEPVKYLGNMTLIKVHLITGKTHQIRAHLASIGHPVAGDYKYGDRQFNDNLKKQYGIKAQMLHSYMLIFPMLNNELANLSHKKFTAPLPEYWLPILED